MNPKRVVVAGGTGFIGSELRSALAKKGFDVVIVSRRPGAGQISWEAGALTSAIEGSTAVVNLAGESVVSGRWTEGLKRRLIESRVESAAAIVGAIGRCKIRPPVLVNASATGYYGSHGDETLDESSAAGQDFLADLCVKWEAEAAKTVEFGVRAVPLRIGVVLGTKGGALPRMLPAFKLGVGGPLGSGNQWMSWIHIDDLVNLTVWIVENRNVSGPVNGTAPYPVTNEQFSKTLAATLHRPCLFRAPAFALRLALGEMSGILLEGQRVLPREAQSKGFQFQHPKLAGALRALLAKQPLSC